MGIQHKADSEFKSIQVSIDDSMMQIDNVNIDGMDSKKYIN